MLLLSDDPAEAEKVVRPFVKHWMKLLAQNRLDEACSMIDEPNEYGNEWTPARIRHIVQDTYGPETRFYQFHPEGPVFTDPDELEEQTDKEFMFSDDGSMGFFDYDVPLNHEWSGLTALWVFYRRANGFAAVLHDLHVL